jgi:uncharacterized protein (DUF305 family)
MKKWIAIAALAVAACKSAGTVAPKTTPAGPAAAPIIQPGAPGQDSHPVTAEHATDLSHVLYVGADIKFMQGMIGHHAQAVEMVDLLKKNTASDDMRKLGQRIELSQVDEIAMMQRWLHDRGQQVPSTTAMHAHGATLMPGMLTPEEMATLGAARGKAFDRLFLEGMIKHHGGALLMVEQLFAEPGAAQDSDIFAFASDVDADQRTEINRMGAMLRELQK